MAQQSEETSDPRHHVKKIEGQLEDLIQHLRNDIERVEDPRAQALFETSAEVLGGLLKAYQHFDEKSEEAWRYT